MRVGIVGIDGAGKTTLAHALAEHYRESGYRVQARTSRSLGPMKRALKLIRSMGYELPRDLYSSEQPMSAQTQVVYGVLKWHSLQDALGEVADGSLAIVDRTRDCQIAAASVLHTQNRAFIEALMRTLPRVEVTVWLDLDATTAAARLLARGERQPDEAFLGRFASAYGLLADRDWIKIDASDPPDVVLASVVRELQVRGIRKQAFRCA